MLVNISQLDPGKLTDQQMADLLFKNMQDDGKQGDLIFVPGSSKAVQYRLPKAIELYKAGRANKILFSGGVVWDGNSLSEAESLKHEALKQGIPKEDILVENLALHTKENVLASLLVLDRAFYLHNIERIIAVTTAYHLRRFHLTLKTYMPNWIDYTLCPVNDQQTNEDNWFKTSIGRQRVEAEVEKLIHYVKLGVLVDEQVEITLEEE